MSIIYEALKKVEGLGLENLVKKTDKERRHGPKVYLIYALVVLLGIFLANLFFTVLPRQLPLKGQPQDKYLSQSVAPKSSSQTVADETAIPASRAPAPLQKVRIQPAQGPAFVLNGVFFSGDEGYALINNRILKKGDQIDGATVVRIDLDEVELESEGTAIKLSGASQ